MPIDVENLGLWLKAAFGAPVTSGTTPKTHTFQSGNWTLPSMAIETAMPEVPRYAMYTGCVCDQLSWQMARSGLLTATARLVAQGESVAATTAAGTPTSLSLQRFGHFNGAITRNGPDPQQGLLTMSSFEELLLETSQQLEARPVAAAKMGMGGVDPLGLRQINFELMDQVLPDLNNVARHIRPYIVMTWAWRRVKMIVKSSGMIGANAEQMRDFVDRIEAIYAWSQFLHQPQSDLPGRQAMQELMTAPKYHFGGAQWAARRDMRRESTGIISPLNYGPSLRTLGWLLPVESAAGVFQPDPALDPVLDEFESAIRTELAHEAFNKFGPVTVSREDAVRWGALWSLDGVTEVE